MSEKSNKMLMELAAIHKTENSKWQFRNEREGPDEKKTKDSTRNSGWCGPSPRATLGIKRIFLYLGMNFPKSYLVVVNRKYLYIVLLIQLKTGTKWLGNFI